MVVSAVITTLLETGRPERVPVLKIFPPLKTSGPVPSPNVAVPLREMVPAAFVVPPV